MDSAYISSTVYALRAKGSLSSLYFNDHNNSSYCFLADRFDRYRNRSSLSKCCSCCGVSSPKVTTIINRSYLYGPRQSLLLHWSAYRKLILSGGDRFCNYVYSNNNYKCRGVKRDCCCGVSSCVSETAVCSNRNIRRKSRVLCRCRCRCVVGEGDSGEEEIEEDDDDTEALLSLLSEEVGGRIKRRNRGLIKNGRDSKSLDSYERVLEMKKKKESGWRSVESDGKRGFESARVESKSGGEFSRGEKNQNCGARRERSSSYHSVSSSSGDVDEDNEVHDKHELYEGSRVNSERNEHRETSKSENMQSERLSEEVLESSRRGERVSTDSRERFIDTKEASSNSYEVGEASVYKRKSEQNKELRDFKRDDAKSTSQSRVSIKIMEEKAEILKRDTRHREISYKADEQNIKRNTQRERIVSEAQDHDTQRTSVSQSRAEIGVADVKYREKVSSSLQEREERLRSQTSQQATRISEIYDIDANVEKTSVTQSQNGVANQVNNRNLKAVSYERPTEPRAQTSRRTPQRLQSERRSHIADDTNMVRASETERIMDSRVTSETRVRRESEETYLGMVAGNTRVSTTQSDVNRRPIRPRDELEKSSVSQESLRLDYPARAHKDKVEEGSRRSSQTMVTPPRSQSLSRNSVHAELESGFERQKVLDTSSRRQPLDSQEALYGRTESHELPNEPIYPAGPEDALGSAERSLESSSQFVEEFVEKARLEASSSGTDARLAIEGDKASSSGGLGTKGPSAEMWDVANPLVVKTQEAEEPKPPAAENKAVVKRNGKSIWSIIGDIVTLKRGPRSEPATVSAGSSRRQNHPSEESAVSEAWFSTNESEHSRGKNSKGSRSETRSDQLQVTEFSTPGRGTESDGLADPLPLRSRVGSGSTSQRISVSGSENLGWNESNIGRSSQASPSEMEIVESPLQPSTGVEISMIVPQVSGPVKMDVGPEKKIEQLGTGKVGEASEVVDEGSSGGELKRRKLQRIKQVPKDMFDEWEEAFSVETEQRRLDEMFMREALLEANKAADMWEVPVGSVLVQNGTIIARGYNLVEDLRDSTAHAEMICIREASNQLQSWRLADTTLYVTLEPCPMCAGAILQARVNTLVWGAPNTLLGADGSWIRLFPDGGDGEVGKSDKPAQSPHPFHPNMNIRRGVLATECAEVMKQFFQLRRKNKKDKEKQEAEDSHSSRLSLANPSKLLKKMHYVFHVIFCL